VLYCYDIFIGLHDMKFQTLRKGFPCMHNSKRLPTAASSFPIKSIFRTKSTQEPVFRKCLDLKDCLDSTKNKNIQLSYGSLILPCHFLVPKQTKLCRNHILTITMRERLLNTKCS
jgi:hypothetical protein